MSKEVVRSKEVEFKLREEVAKARNLLVNMTLSKEKLDVMVNDTKIPNGKRGLGFEDNKDNPSLGKTVFVKSMDITEPRPSQHPRNKLNL